MPTISTEGELTALCRKALARDWSDDDALPMALEAVEWLASLLGRSPLASDLTPHNVERLGIAWEALLVAPDDCEALGRALRRIWRGCARHGLCAPPGERSGSPAYLPGPAEIAAACESIRAGWSAAEEESRRAWSIAPACGATPVGDCSHLRLFNSSAKAESVTFAAGVTDTRKAGFSGPNGIKLGTPENEKTP